MVRVKDRFKGDKGGEIFKFFESSSMPSVATAASLREEQGRQYNHQLLLVIPVFIHNFFNCFNSKAKYSNYFLIIFRTQKMNIALVSTG